MTEATDKYAVIMASTPPIRWAMPAGGASVTDIVNRNEYREMRLEKASRIYWQKTSGSRWLMSEPDAVDLDWAVSQMRQALDWVLDGKEPQNDDSRLMGWCLDIVDAIQVERCSSAAREQGR